MSERRYIHARKFGAGTLYLFTRSEFVAEHRWTLVPDSGLALDLDTVYVIVLGSVHGGNFCWLSLDIKPVIYPFYSITGNTIYTMLSKG